MQIRLARCVVIGLQTAVITGQFYITAWSKLSACQIWRNSCTALALNFFSVCFNAWQAMKMIH